MNFAPASDYMASQISQNTAIELLLIGVTADVTNLFLSSLRNAGFAAHASRQDTGDALADSLNKNKYDLVICNCENSGLTLDQTKDAMKLAGSDGVLLMALQKRNSEALVFAMEEGARDLVSWSDLEHFNLVVAREVDTLKQRRQLAEVQLQLQESEARCNALIETAQEAVAYIHEGMHVDANVAYLKLFGFESADDLAGIPILDIVIPDDHATLKKLLKKLVKETESSAEMDATCASIDGTSFAAHLEFSPSAVDGEPCTQVVVRRGIVPNNENQQIAYGTEYDPLTGLLRRQFFITQVTQLLDANGNSSRHSLLFIRLDDFLGICKYSGFGVGDAIIKEFSDLLSDLVGEKTLLTHFSDDSFCALSPLIDIHELETQANQICTATAEHLFETTAKLVSPTCSVGIAPATADAENAEHWIRMALESSEYAQQQGGNRYATYAAATSTNDESESDGQSLLGLVERALKEDRFRLVFQPIVSLKGDTKENYAVLLRLLDEDDEELLPHMFLKQAIDAGLMPRIDRWVIRHAMKELANQRQEGRDINFFISIAGISINDDDLLPWISKTMQDTEIRGSWVTFQFRDADVRSHLQESKTLFEGLKKIDCQLAIDHFGLNPKPESLLNHIPIDIVKLAPEFMKNLANNQERQKQLKDINRLAQEAKVRTIATSVEDANSLAVLWSVGISYIQGYFLQEPSDTISYDFNN